MSLADVGAFLTTNRVPHNQQQTQPFQSSSYIPFEEYAMRAPLTTLRPRFPTPCPTIPNNILVYDILHKETTVEAVIDVPGATDENVTLVWNNNGDPTVTVVRTIRTLNASDYYGRPSGTFSVALPIHQYINVNENPRWQLQNGVLRLVFTKRTTPADPISLRSLVCIDSAEDTSESAPQLNIVASETCRRSFESDTSPLRPNAYRERLLEQKLFNRKRHQGKDKDEEFVVSLQVSDGENRWRPILEDEWIKPSMLILVKRLPYDYAIGRIHTVKLSAAYPAITFSKQTRVVSLENLDTEDDKITEVINLAGHEDSEKLDPVIPLYEDPSLVPRDVNYVCHICQQKGHERRNCPIANDGLTGKSCDKITSVMKTLPSGIPMRDLEEVSHQHVAQAEYKTVDGKLYKRKIDHVPTDNVARCCYCSIRYCNDQKLGAHTTVQTPCCQKFICHSCYQWAGFNSSLTVCLKCKKTVWQD